MYTVKHYKTKKQLKDDLALGRQIECYQPGPFPDTQNGCATIEGPHYPEPHRWYARVELRDSIIVKVIS